MKNREEFIIELEEIAREAEEVKRTPVYAYIDIKDGWDPGIRSYGYPMGRVTRYEGKKEKSMFERLKEKFKKKESGEILIGGLFKELEDPKQKQINQLYKNLEEIDAKIEEKENKLYDEIEKLRRVIKYGKDGEVIHNLEFILDNSNKKTKIGFYPNFYHYAYLYIYKDCEEYKICLTELDDKQNYINMDSESFSTDKDFAYYKVDCKYEWGVVSHSFVIDFKKGTYLHSKEEIEKEVEEVKEVWDDDRKRFDYK